MGKGELVMRISTRGSYALEAVLAIAMTPESKSVSIREISERTMISDNYLEQIFSLLRNGGIIKSLRGAQGGYSLARSPSLISVGDVLRAAEKSLSPVVCIEDPSSCGKSAECAARNTWCRLSSVISDTVDKMSIEDLAKQFGTATGSSGQDYSI
jgi:Rrf2 family transcriptional regulator, cysteine metabolism repressor